MRRFRLSTLLLLIVIVALVLGVLVQQRRLARQQERIAKLENEMKVQLQVEARLVRLLQDQSKRKAAIPEIRSETGRE